MIKCNYLDSVVEIFVKEGGTGKRKNMIASIVLELFPLNNDLAKHLYERHEVVRPYLKKVADQAVINQTEATTKKGDYALNNDQEDLIFNSYEDSAEDEKANQEAFERAKVMDEENKESRLKKISFLTNRESDEQEMEVFPTLLNKTVINNQNSPKIEIDSQFRTHIKPDENNDDEALIINKSILENDAFDNKPIEFIKADDKLIDTPNEQLFEEIEGKISGSDPTYHNIELSITQNEYDKVEQHVFGEDLDYHEHPTDTLNQNDPNDVSFINKLKVLIENWVQKYLQNAQGSSLPQSLIEEELTKKRDIKASDKNYEAANDIMPGEDTKFEDDLKNNENANIDQK